MTVPCCDSTTSQTLRLNDDEVHVWCATLDAEAPQLEFFWQTLSQDEMARAKGFYSEQDRRRFVMARGLFRLILSRYLDTEPGQLRFFYSPYGKPVLADSLGRGALNFNLAHSGGLVLYAITCNRAIGVDVERMRTDFAYQELVGRFFSPRERRILRGLPPDTRCEAFFSGWTRKEAYLKARGDGLGYPPDQVEVSLGPGEPARLLSIGGDYQEACRWSLQTLGPLPGYAAALAVEGYDWRLIFREWTDLTG
jgi:4'-phosphopantetheinyl transferase